MRAGQSMTDTENICATAYVPTVPAPPQVSGPAWGDAVHALIDRLPDLLPEGPARDGIQAQLSQCQMDGWTILCEVAERTQAARVRVRPTTGTGDPGWDFVDVALHIDKDGTPSLEISERDLSNGAVEVIGGEVGGDKDYARLRLIKSRKF